MSVYKGELVLPYRVEADPVSGNEKQLSASLMHGISSYGLRTNFIKSGYTIRPACLRARLLICLSARQSGCLYACASACFAVCLSVCLPYW